MANEIKMGARIKALRIEKKLSQEQLAEKLDVMQNMISKYENDVNLPSLEILVMLADIFETSTDYLLGRVDE